MRDLTGSSLQAAAQCPASHALPLITQPSSEYATDGHDVHAYLAAQALSQDVTTLLSTMSERARRMCLAIDTQALWLGLHRFAPEASFRLVVTTGTAVILGYQLERRYPARPHGCIDGTVDLIAYTVDTDAPVLLEYKTGKDVGPIADNWQVAFGALCLLAVTSAPAVECRLVYVGESPVRVVSHRVMASERNALIGALRAIWNRVESARDLVGRGHVPDVSPGDACTYCSAQPHCPAYTRALLLLLERKPDEALTREIAGEAWESLRRAETFLAGLRGQLLSMVVEEPLPLSNGREVAMVPSRGRPVFDVARAVAWLREAGYADDVIETLYREGKPYLRAQERKVR